MGAAATRGDFSLSDVLQAYTRATEDQPPKFNPEGSVKLAPLTLCVGTPAQASTYFDCYMSNDPTGAQKCCWKVDVGTDDSRCRPRGN